MVICRLPHEGARKGAPSQSQEDFRVSDAGWNQVENHCLCTMVIDRLDFHPVASLPREGLEPQGCANLNELRGQELSKLAAATHFAAGVSLDDVLGHQEHGRFEVRRHRVGLESVGHNPKASPTLARDGDGGGRPACGGHAASREV